MYWGIIHGLCQQKYGPSPCVYMHYAQRILRCFNTQDLAPSAVSPMHCASNSE